MERALVRNLALLAVTWLAGCSSQSAPTTVGERSAAPVSAADHGGAIAPLPIPIMPIPIMIDDASDKGGDHGKGDDDDDGDDGGDGGGHGTDGESCKGKRDGASCDRGGGACAVDQCQHGACVSLPGHKGAICRAAAGECDEREVCDGANVACPADVKKPSAALCSGDDNPCTLDQCDGAHVTCQHPAGNRGAVCRAAAGPCDAAETCNGTSTACPANAYLPSSTVCRAAGAGDECDLPEKCPGNGPNCPPDAKKARGTVCAEDGNPCTVDKCDGTHGACQHTAGNQNAVCRAAAGFCDVPETCNGSSTACPDNVFLPSSTVCRAAAGICDAAETCTGAAANCPADRKSTAVCRAAAGPCDVAESCNGVGNNCPADAFLPSSTSCRPSAGPCDIAENCPGNAAGCPADLYQPSTTTCRAAAGVCDEAESCTGTGANCPADGKKASTTVCRAPANDCDLAESCDGSTNDCPADAFKPNTTQTCTFTSLTTSYPNQSCDPNGSMIVQWDGGSGATTGGVWNEEVGSATPSCGIYPASVCTGGACDFDQSTCPAGLVHTGGSVTLHFNQPTWPDCFSFSGDLNSDGTMLTGLMDGLSFTAVGTTTCATNCPPVCLAESAPCDPVNPNCCDGLTCQNGPAVPSRGFVQQSACLPPPACVTRGLECDDTTGPCCDGLTCQPTTGDFSPGTVAVSECQPPTPPVCLTQSTPCDDTTAQCCDGLSCQPVSGPFAAIKQCLPPTCHPVGVACSDSTPCCDGLSCGGPATPARPFVALSPVCVPVTPTCLLQDAPCDPSASGCCTGLTCQDPGSGPTCQPPVCSMANVTCGSSADCCSGLVCGPRTCDFTPCPPGLACIPAGTCNSTTPCINANDCCPGFPMCSPCNLCSNSVNFTGSVNGTKLCFNIP